MNNNYSSVECENLTSSDHILVNKKMDQVVPDIDNYSYSDSENELIDVGVDENFDTGLRAVLDNENENEYIDAVGIESNNIFDSESEVVSVKSDSEEEKNIEIIVLDSESEQEDSEEEKNIENIVLDSESEKEEEEIFLDSESEKEDFITEITNFLNESKNNLEENIQVSESDHGEKETFDYEGLYQKESNSSDIEYLGACSSKDEIIFILKGDNEDEVDVEGEEPKPYNLRKRNPKIDYTSGEEKMIKKQKLRPLFDVERVIATRGVGRKKRHLVKFVGYHDPEWVWDRDLISINDERKKKEEEEGRRQIKKPKCFLC